MLHMKDVAGQIRYGRPAGTGGGASCSPVTAAMCRVR